MVSNSYACTIFVRGMALIIITERTPGLTTTEKVLALIQQSPEGISTIDIGHKLNRPISMVLRCLKVLKNKRLIHVKQSDGMHLLYYPGRKKYQQRRRDVA